MTIDTPNETAQRPRLVTLSPSHSTDSRYTCIAMPGFNFVCEQAMYRETPSRPKRRRENPRIFPNVRDARDRFPRKRRRGIDARHLCMSAAGREHIAAFARRRGASVPTFVSDSGRASDIYVACIGPVPPGRRRSLGCGGDSSALRSQLCTEHSCSRPHLDVQLALLECSLVYRLQHDAARSRRSSRRRS